MSITETNVATLRANLADVLDTVAKGNIVSIKSRGKSRAAIISDDLLWQLEDIIAANNPRIIKKVASARKDPKTYTFEEVFSDVV